MNHTRPCRLVTYARVRASLSAVTLLVLVSRFAVCEEVSDVDVYVSQVKPLLKSRCYACHGALKQEAGLRLDTGEFIRRGGDSGSVIRAGLPDESLLLERVSAADEDERMPPEGQPLTLNEIERIRRWITIGATSPEDELAERDPRDHWSFQKAVRPSLPTLGLSTHPIDRLLEAGRTARGLQTMGAAERSLLLRRVYLDLIGIPPTASELEAFRQDARPEAYEEVVDQLLDRAEYGQRWARHWMDIWRYSDWYGLGDQLRNSQKHLWHWRDWIVESLNADKGYDQMILEMLAGDELAPTDPQTFRATGFLARNYYLFNRTTWLDDTLEHTCKAFLGLTINCTKCHDHKYDPLRQEDYYALRAVFEPHQVRLDVAQGETDLEINGIPRAFDAHPDAVTHLHLRGDEKQPDLNRVMTPNTPQFLPTIPFAPQAVKLPQLATRPELQAFFWRDLLRQAAEQAKAAREELERLQHASAESADSTDAAEQDCVSERDAIDVQLAEMKLREASLRIDLLSAMHAAELAKQSNAATCEQTVAEAARAARRHELAKARWLLAQAERQALAPKAPPDAAQKVKEAREQVTAREASLDEPGTEYPLPRASRKALEGPDEGETSRFAAYPDVTTGRRTALGRWIVHPDNPLTARVAVNHIWLRHFGQPLVEPVDDFGRRTPAPLQQPLLDWLAVELVESGWRMKHLHRLIVTSHTYQLAVADATADAATRAADPENLDYWCRRPMRMQSEVIRDSILHLAGMLDTTAGGPTLDPRRDEAPYRRSLYFTHSRDDQHALLAMFDDPDIFACYRRQESVVPQQALALSNSQLALTMSAEIARRIAESARAEKPADGELSDPDFVQQAFRTLLCRAAESAEVEACLRALHAWRQLDDATAQERARINLTHSLLNHNDFVTIR